MARKNTAAVLPLVATYTRLDRGVVASLRKAAARNSRSVSSQIRVVLKAWADGKPVVP